MVGPIWYYVEGGQSIGPVSFDLLRQMVEQGRLSANDLVWREGAPDWQVACTVPGLVPPALGYVAPATHEGSVPRDPLEDLAAAQHGGYAGTPDYYGGSGATSKAYHGRRPVGQSQQGMAIAGFVLSLTVPLLGLIFSWVALSGMKRTRNEEGKGFATAGLIISLVFVGLACLWIIGLVSCLGAGLHVSGP
ncbi:MAG: hypothetical protein JWN40_4437 [Phycisphaerales bacterium]|nr:hypothetical protein [Phycisphaerales bacterium]